MDANSNVVKLQPQQQLKCFGASRDAENDKALVLTFNRKISDDELRFIHECIQRAASFAGDA